MKKQKDKRNRTKKDKLKISILGFLAKRFFQLESFTIGIGNVNYPKETPCIFALWHAHQCVLYGNMDRRRLHVLISHSNDGEIIAQAVEGVGINTVRGSSKRSGVSSTLQLIEKLEAGDSIAITVDGPRGPRREVKDGVLTIAKLSQVPIIPLVWYSTSPLFLKFDTWDEFRFPLGFCPTVALYGDPIYIPADCDKDKLGEYKLLLENKMSELYDDLIANYEKYEKESTPHIKKMNY